MSVKGIIIALCVILCVSCKPRNEDDVPVPDYILKEQVFIDMLTDCYLGEGAAGINVKNVTGTKFDSAYLFNPFKDNGISKQQFDTTIVWYSQHPKKLKEIYNKLLENLSRIQAVGNLNGIRVIEDKYTGQDPLFFILSSKKDSVDNATKKAGYATKYPYLLN